MPHNDSATKSRLCATKLTLSSLILSYALHLSEVWFVAVASFRMQGGHSFLSSSAVLNKLCFHSPSHDHSMGAQVSGSFCHMTIPSLVLVAHPAFYLMAEAMLCEAHILNPTAVNSMGPEKKSPY